MKQTIGIVICHIAIFVCVFSPMVFAADDADQFFESRIRPVLIERCFECHGRNEPKGELRVDSREALIKGGDSGAAIVPGNAENSLLVRAIRHTDADLQMPPKTPLPQRIVADFVQWIDSGARWPVVEPLVQGGDPAFRPNHWAFQSIKPVSLPEIVDKQFEHPIDRFVANQWVELGLKPVEQADSRTLVRRLYFDLSGMPPAREELDSAVAGLTPFNDAAWNSLVEKLLSSPHYGERWGRHWLDVVRYADTAGDNADYPVPESRLYRDYVIDAFNNDKPYDQFVREQIAGDLLAKEGPPDKYAERIIATGFLALSRRYATAPYELWHLTLEDTIDTVGQTFVGLTFRCARCHDHKFDPMTTKDYYGLYGIFDSTQFPWAGGEEFQSKKSPREHFVPLMAPGEVQSIVAAQGDLEKRIAEQVAKFEAENPQAKELAALTERLAALKSASALPSDIAATKSEHDKLKKQVDAALGEIRGPMETTRRRGFPETIPIAYAVADGKPHSVAIQRSGEPSQPGAVVPRRAPEFLPTIASVDVPDGESGRRQLADWLTRPDHPLTARVMVNRIWQHHFGKGIVASPSNFGTRGSSPSHPELLDWLSTRFIAEGWSIKAVHRLILSSSVWRLASAQQSQNATIDPGNAFLWRHDRERLDAESIRDAMLKVSGRLDLSRPELHPFPHISKWTYTQHTQFHDFYPSNHRSIYLMTSRLQRHPYLALFDSPDTNTTTGQRTSAIVPAQALYLMNSQDLKIEAETFAKRVIAVPSTDRIQTAFSLAYQRDPNPVEREKANEFLSKYIPQSDELTAWTAFCRSLLSSHEFFYVD